MTTTAMPHSSHLLVHRRLRYSSNGPFHRNGLAPKPAVARNWSFGHAALLHDYCTAQATAVAVTALSSVLRAYQAGSREPLGFAQCFSASRHGRGKRRDDARDIYIPVQAIGIVQPLAYALLQPKALGQY